MSYDMVIWEGERPATDAEALEVYIDLLERYLEEETPPAPKIERFVEALLARWPDDGANTPWATGGGGDSGGPVLVVNIALGREVDVAAGVADLAAGHGLVCYDLQEDRLVG